MTTRLMEHIWTSKQVPQEMGEANIVLLPKDPLHPRDPKQQRPISLANIWYKILDKLLTRRLTNHIESEGILSEPQYGFRKGRSTTDHMLTTELITQIQRLRGEATYIMLIDL